MGGAMIRWTLTKDGLPEDLHEVIGYWPPPEDIAHSVINQFGSCFVSNKKWFGENSCGELAPPYMWCVVDVPQISSEDRDKYIRECKDQSS